MTRVSFVDEGYVHAEMVCLLRIRLDRRYREIGIRNRIASVFGFQSRVVARTWNELIRSSLLPKNARIKHILYFLAYMKTYAPVNLYCSMFDVSDKSFLTWVWNFAYCIASMQHIVSILVRAL